MKKQIIDFTKVRYVRRFAPKIQGKMTRFGSAAFKSDEPEETEDEGEKEKLLGKIKGIVKKELGTRATVTQVQEIASQLSFLTKSKNEKGEEVASPFPIETLRAMADEKTGVMAKLVDMGVKIQEYETRAKKYDEEKPLSLREQVAAWQDKNKDKLKDIVENRQKIELPVLQLRVASPMLVSTVNSGASPYIGSVEVESGITPFLRLPNTFWDFLSKGKTNAATYVWVNQSNPLGAAAFIGPGVAKPGISFELVAENSVSKKIAVSGKAGTELLQDIDGMTSMIETELKDQLGIKLNNTLMTATSSSTLPAGIQSLSQVYAFYTSAAAIKTTNPNYMDAVRAVIGALRSGKITGDVTVFLHSVDMTNMDLSKATDSGVYLLPPFVTADGTKIGGARIIEDNNVTVGSIQAGFMKYYKILIHKDMYVQWGWENDDFTKNLITGLAEMRLHQIFNDVYTGAFLYDTFDNVINAIRQA